ncbi:hypothetical protein CPC08DRAFT_771256 [Agrocybe pediades]|nr:hypothetical protein CPC08DRAFT_771256 [Agrocybe pediades]
MHSAPGPSVPAPTAPSRKSNPIVTPPSTPSKSDYLLWNLFMYTRRRTRRGRVGFLAISSSSSGSSNPTPSSAAALSLQEQSKLSNNDFDWVSPPPVSEPAFAAASTCAPTVTSSGPQHQP